MYTACIIMVVKVVVKNVQVGFLMRSISYFIGPIL